MALLISDFSTERKQDNVFLFALILAKEHHYFTKYQLSINKQADWTNSVCTLGAYFSLECIQ